MKPPPFLLGAALLFWGWMIDATWLGASMAVAVESSHWFRARFEFSQTDLDRIWNLCVLLFVAAAVVAFAAGDGFESLNGVMTDNSPARRFEIFNKGAGTAIRFLQWAPAPLLPIVLAQVFAEQERFAWSTFSALLRRRRRARRQEIGTLGRDGREADRGAPARERGINVCFPYFALVLYSAALSGGQGYWFIAGLAVLLGWALWSHRPRTFNLAAWSVTLVCSMVLGGAAQFGLLEAQRLIRRLDGAIMAQFGSGKGYDPKGTRTRLGAIGGMKNSGEIIMRLETDGPPPPLLREASYDSFKSPLWFTLKRHFDRTMPEVVDTSWTLVSGVRGTSTVTISTYLDGGKGLLALPSGSVRLTELPVFLLQTNARGVVQVEEGPGFVRFQARSRPGISLDAAPDENDLMIPQEERSAMERVASDLQLDSSRPADSIRKLGLHFGNHFEYSTWQGLDHRPSSNRTALAAFLLDHRKGHCEYFATATTLLLRAAGIPARYAVGYAVAERQGRFNVVRSRHAHAWTLAWYDGRWQDVDTTPGTWVGAEAHRASFWEPVYDVLSRAWFEFSKWRWGPSEWKQYLVWLIVPLVGLVGARVLFQKQWRRAGAKPGGSIASVAWPGLDSELYRIEERLRAQGFERETGETIARWLNRAGARFTAAQDLFAELVEVHYRLRFDPEGISVEERRAFRSRVEHWLVSAADRQVQDGTSKRCSS